VAASFSFSRVTILAFKDSKELDEPTGKRSALIFRGATVATKGNVVTSAFAAGKVHASLQSFSNCPFSGDEY